MGVDGVVEGQHVCVGHVDDLEAEEARLLLGVGEGGIGEADEPVEVVEDAVVDAEGAVGTDVGGGDADVLKERRVVGAGAEIAEVQTSSMSGRVAGEVVRAMVGASAGVVCVLPLLVHGSAGGWGTSVAISRTNSLARGLRRR